MEFKSTLFKPELIKIQKDILSIRHLTSHVKSQEFNTGIGSLDIDLRYKINNEKQEN